MSTDLRVVDTNQYLTDPQKFEHLWRVASAFAKCDLVPESIRGKPADCFVLCQLAVRLGVDPFMMMQNTYVVHGRPGMEAKMMIALLNASGRIKGNVAYTFGGTGDDYGCTASVIDAASSQKVEGPKVTKRMVKAEGWDKKQGSKWLTMPEVMFRYRSAAMLIRAHYPEVTLGLMTREELEEQVIDVESTLAQPALPPATGSKSDAIAAALAQRKAEEPAPEPEPEVTRTPDESQEVAEPTADEQDAADNQARLLEEYCGLIGAAEDHASLKEIADKARADTTLTPENAELIAKAGRAKWKDLSVAKG